MQITAKTWNEYITRLSRLNQKAGQLMREYIGSHDTESTDDLIAYAYGLVTKYGEGSAELACQMYDALAEAANAGVPAAEPAEPADYGEVSPWGTQAHSAPSRAAFFRVVSAPARLTRRLTPLGRLAGFWFLVAFTMRATSP